ncbi:LOW QUALITY PROTEIN: olfactory receptor 52D1-like [Cottoperca gobio]|uniref:Olfactory receptor n=1 Tax=Cottoperca gobio TaxID=56716 RepID=A0A6J2R2X2_COTGO|nr:LOW QUALITY PROTEIN: olfactory receptor 52D1-like [Cottoperca gobio]
MDNMTALTFTMTAYTAMENYKHGLFAVFLLIYFIILILNSLLITLIHQNKELHQPMNMFTCMLSINELYGSTALLPAIMAVLMSETHEIIVKWCMAQVYFLHTYATAEFCILAVMGYDRYAAICFPLHYHSIMSNSKISKLVALASLYPLIVFGCFYSLTLQLSFCGKVMPKLYCVNMELVKNACSNSNTSYISSVGLVLLPAFIMPQVLMIVFSYVQISRECRKLARESQINALKTCIPHLLSLLNYTIGCLFEIIQSRFKMSHVSVEARIFLSLYFIFIPPIANPVLYGLGTQIVRVHILKLFIRYKIMSTNLIKAMIVA